MEINYRDYYPQSVYKHPVLMAAAATKSLHEGRPVKISEIEA